MIFLTPLRPGKFLHLNKYNFSDRLYTYMEVTEIAKAKINLSLDIRGTREETRDGKKVLFHEVAMIMHSVSLSDMVTVHLSDGDRSFLSIKSNGPLPSIPEGADNLCIRAAELMRKALSIEDHFFISLEKNIPSAAGLGGGSSDAAAVMRAINRLYDSRLSIEEMGSLSTPLGADIPYCLSGGTKLSTGIGEKLSDLPLFPTMPCVLVKPNFPISTKEAYGRYDEMTEKGQDVKHPDTDALVSFLKDNELDPFFNNTRNVLEEVCVREHKEISRIEDDAKKSGALFSMMSGSGPTVFSIFNDEKKAIAFQEAYEKKEGIEGAFFCFT